MMPIVFFSSAANWFAAMQAEWRAFRKSRPGKRFEERYERKAKSGHSAWRKALLPAVGLVIIALGLILLPAPGPGIPIVLIGVALVSEQFLWMARLLDRAEPPIRSAVGAALKWWGNASTMLRRVVALIAGLLALATGALVFALLA